LIRRWEYEPVRLVFTNGGKRVGYVPDFRVTRNDGTQFFREDKGKLDPRSRMKLRLARKAGHHVQLVRRGTLDKERRHLGVKIEHWEGGKGNGKKKRKKEVPRGI